MKITTFIGFALAIGWTSTVQAGSVCPKERASIVIDTKTHGLSLCRNGKRVGRFVVALGRGGVDKRKEGHNKTPLGRYRLGRPTHSKKFHRFVPIAYPTRAQRKKGFTGSAIGIHGPRRSLRTWGALNLLMDWTQGCIAVSSDTQIESIVRWVRKHKPRFVYLR